MVMVMVRVTVQRAGGVGPRDKSPYTRGRGHESCDELPLAIVEGSYRVHLRYAWDKL